MTGPVGIAVFGLIIAIAVVVLSIQTWRWADNKTANRTWQTLVNQASSVPEKFHPSLVENLPDPARRFFLFTIDSGSVLHTVSIVSLSGQIGLGNKDEPDYQSMNARQILSPPFGFVWRLKTHGAMRLSGSDGFDGEQSWVRFWLFGTVPVVREGGSDDHRRAAFGRLIAEAVFWAPAALLPHNGVSWSVVDQNRTKATVTFRGMTQEVEVTVAEDGQPVKVVIPRWSNANHDKTYRWQPFGGFVTGFKKFDGYHLPTKIEGGNFIGSDDYFPFYKVQVQTLKFVGSSAQEE